MVATYRLRLAARCWWHNCRAVQAAGNAGTCDTTCVLRTPRDKAATVQQAWACQAQTRTESGRAAPVAGLCAMLCGAAGRLAGQVQLQGLTRPMQSSADRHSLPVQAPCHERALQSLQHPAQSLSRWLPTPSLWGRWVTGSDSCSSLGRREVASWDLLLLQASSCLPALAHLSC